LFGSEQAAREEVIQQYSYLFGEESKGMIRETLENAQRPELNFPSVVSVISLLLLLFAATNVFAELQDALNTMWGVKPKYTYWLKEFIWVRALSFAMIMVIGFLLLTSLVISALIANLSEYLTGFLGSDTFLQTINFILSFLIITFLFAMIFKFLPDVKIRWSHVWVGAVLTSLLFSLGKQVIGLYLGQSSFGSAYGAASSLVILLVWVYYSSLIFFYGAEFTQVYARNFGTPIRPTHRAVRSDPIKKDISEKDEEEKTEAEKVIEAVDAEEKQEPPEQKEKDQVSPSG
jgi:membrane protein